MSRAISDEGCTCSAEQFRNREACMSKIVRCPGRMKWLRENDEKFRKVWGIEKEGK